MGWDSLKHASGLSKQMALGAYLEATVSGSAFSSFPVEPATGESLGLTARSGPFVYTDGTTVQLAGLSTMDLSSNDRVAADGIGLLPQSFYSSWPTFLCSAPANSVDQVLGQVYSYWYMVPKERAFGPSLRVEP